MASKPAKSGQRARPDTGDARGGAKRRSPTSNSHRGSRVEPSHITKQQRSTRAKKSAKGRR